VSADRMITEQLRADRQRHYAQRAMTESLRAHRETILSGRSVMTANRVMVEEVRRHIRIDERATASEVEEKGSFRRGFEALAQTALEGLVSPLVEGLLNILGLDEFPRLRGAVQRVLVNTFTNILTDERYSILSLTCEDIGRALAESVAETLPEKIFDEMVGSSVDLPLVPSGMETSLMLTVREAIGNFFKDQRVIQTVSDHFGKIICNIDLSRLLSTGGREIARAWKQGQGPTPRRF